MKVYGQLEKAQLENTTSDTSSLPKGMATYRTDINQMKVSDGSSMVTMVDTANNQTLLNKTLANPVVTGSTLHDQISTPSTPASGFNRTYFKSDGRLYTLDSSGNESQVGSGQGGVKNYISNGDAESTAVSIFVPYADTGTRPVDGTGGSPTVTTSIDATGLLETKSYLLTKPSSNCQGQGWSVPFTIPALAKAQMLTVSFDYIVTSGTFTAGTNSADSDVIIYIYDVTNAKLIEPTSIKLLSSSTSVAGKFLTQFQTSYNSTSYRLIAHVATTSANAYTLAMDNIVVGPQNFSGYAPHAVAFNGVFSTNVGISGMYYAIPFVSTLDTHGGWSGSTYTVKVGGKTKIFASVPFYQNTAGGGNAMLILYINNVVTTSSYHTSTIQNTGETLSLNWEYQATVGDTIQIKAYNTAGAMSINAAGSSSLTIETSIPDSLTVSNYDGRVVCCSYKLAATTSFSSAYIKYDTKFDDTHGIYNTSTGIGTIPVSGYYMFGAQVFSTSTTLDVSLFRNGVEIVRQADRDSSNNFEPYFGKPVWFNAGDTFGVYSNQNSSFYGAVDNYFYLFLLSGSQQILVGQKYIAQYCTSGTQAVATNAVVNFDQKITENMPGYITTGAGTWKFTAPFSDTFTFNVVTQSSPTASLFIFKNGNQSFATSAYLMETSTSIKCSSITLDLQAGEYVQVAPDSGTTFGYNATHPITWISITSKRG